MAQDLDLDSYLARVGWTGPVPATAATLSGLLRAHVERIPFENLDVLLKRPVRLDLAGVQAKLVAARRGGYCFEHATLFAAVLERLGFRVGRHTARVVLVAPRHAAPRAHMFLTVELPEGRFVVDPGFGGLAPRAPVPLRRGQRVKVERDTHWLSRDDGYWVLRTRAGGKDADLWVTTLDRDNLVDFEVGNHFTATHPASPFVNRVMLRAFVPGGTVSVMNRDVTLVKDGKAFRRVLADRRELRALLEESFGFDLPEAESVRVPMIPEWS